MLIILFYIIVIINSIPGVVILSEIFYLLYLILGFQEKRKERGIFQYNLLLSNLLLHPPFPIETDQSNREEKEKLHTEFHHHRLHQGRGERGRGQ